MESTRSVIVSGYQGDFLASPDIHRCIPCMSLSAFHWVLVLIVDSFFWGSSVCPVSLQTFHKPTITTPQSSPWTNHVMWHRRQAPLVFQESGTGEVLPFQSIWKILTMDTRLGRSPGHCHCREHGCLLSSAFWNCRRSSCLCDLWPSDSVRQHHGSACINHCRGTRTLKEPFLVFVGTGFRTFYLVVFMASS